MILSGLSLWEKGSPLHKSTQQVRTQGPIRHADCRQRKLADFLCTGGIIQDPIILGQTFRQLNAPVDERPLWPDTGKQHCQ